MPFNYSDGYNTVVSSNGVNFIEVWQVMLTCTADATITFQALNVDTSETTILSGDLFVPAGTNFQLTPLSSLGVPLFELESNENFIMYINSTGDVSGLMYWVYA